MSLQIARNALLAAIYASVSLILPSTALANYRLTTSLYVLAAFDPKLIPGLVLGNAIAGIPQGPVDIALGGIVAFLAAFACSRLPVVWSPVAIFVIPTVFVPVWLGWLFHVPYWAVVPVLAVGQALSCVVAWCCVIPVARRILR